MIDNWGSFFKSLEEKKYYIDLLSYVDKQYKDYVIYPSRENIFKAFEITELGDVRVVIIGQDPYFNPNQATGLSFSVPSKVTLPPSLKNIFKEIENEYNVQMKSDGDLTYLAKQGVFLFNTILTVRAGFPLSHDIPEYVQFTRDVFDILDKQQHPIVFLLWGGSAKKYRKYLSNPSHLVLEANHPSPLSANRGGWFGNNHFKQVNEFLIANGEQEITWKN